MAPLKITKHVFDENGRKRELNEGRTLKKRKNRKTFIFTYSAETFVTHIRKIGLNDVTRLHVAFSDSFQENLRILLIFFLLETVMVIITVVIIY